MHHHGSRYSSNSAWLNVTHPKIGVISVGAGNSYGHPTVEALGRLHAVGTKTYWTSGGGGAAPVVGLDVIAGSVKRQKGYFEAGLEPASDDNLADLLRKIGGAARI